MANTKKTYYINQVANTGRNICKICISLAIGCNSIGLIQAEEMYTSNHVSKNKADYLHQSIADKDTLPSMDLPLGNGQQINTKVATLKPAADQTDLKKIVINKHVTIEQKAYADYEQSMHYLEQGRVAEAQDRLRSALKQSEHFDDARQTLLRLLIERGRLDEALLVLKKGVAVSPANLTFSKGLARLNLGAGDIESAYDVLNQSLTYADQDAAYHVLLATVLQKMNQHDKAIWHYKHAITLGGVKPTWLIGLGVSLEAEGYQKEARTVFQKVATSRLSPTLAHYVAKKLKQLR